MREVRRVPVPRVRAGLCALVLCVAAGCSGSGGSGDASAPVLAPSAEDPADGPLEIAPLPPVQPTAATNVSTTVSATSSPTTTGPSATAASTTTTATTVTTTTTATTTTRPTTTTPAAPAPPCDIGRIVAETDTDYDTITPADVRCVDVWATWIGRPDDQFADGFFAVAIWTGTSWELANLGTAGVCADAGVPTALWDRLGCFD